MTRRMWMLLVIPLALVSLIALAIHAFWDWDGLLVNLATEVFGILVTVAYVDWIIRRHEDERWAGTQARVNRIIRTFVNGAITGLREPFRVHFRELDEQLKIEVNAGLADLERAEAMLEEFSQNNLEPNLRIYIEMLDREGWKAYAAHLKSTASRADALLDRYESRLKPEQIERLLDIQEFAESARFLERVFPEFAGLTIEELRALDASPDLREVGYDMAARETAKMLSAARALCDA